MDVTNFLADNAVYESELLCDISNSKLCLQRDTFVTAKYWGTSAECDVSAHTVESVASIADMARMGPSLLKNTGKMKTRVKLELAHLF